MATRSFNSRPTPSGDVHLDGVPSHQLPLALAARCYRFAQDITAASPRRTAALNLSVTPRTARSAARG